MSHAPQTLDATASHQLGLAAFAEGDLLGAVKHLRRAVASAPAEPEYRNDLGVVLSAAGDRAGARAVLEAALALDGGHAQAANNLGTVLEGLGEDSAAIDAYRRALVIDPGYVDARDNLVLACARSAPPWHFPMMADAARNAAYDEALARAAPGRRVLDIGTGAGLLAMMAARAGARTVTTCEMSPAVAAAAREVIAANGFAEQIVLHAKRSYALELGADLPERAEVLVTETFASGLLSEHVLPTVEDAHRRLLAPHAVVIPARATALGYLVAGEAIEAQLFACASAGFNLTPFDRLAPVKLGLHLDRVRHAALSDDFAIFTFDLMQAAFPPERRTFPVTVTAAGRCLGVAQWLRLDLDAHARYENRPSAGAGANGWMHVLYRFPQPIDLKAGQTLPLLASHNRTAMTVTLAGA
jgi:tetratricopeptide (TPR) repeat protein